MTRLVVVGAGVSGLAAAHQALRLEPSVDLTVLGSEARAGGLIRTERVDGFVIEHGPDAILTEKPEAVRLAREVGLDDELMGTEEANRGAYVLWRGSLVRIPQGFSMLAPGLLMPMLTSPLLSPVGKLRVLVEPLLPRRRAASDESVANFVRRRLGREVLERLAQPLVGGVYGADPELLSLRATLPRFHELEQTHGSVMLGLRRARRGQELATGARYGLFASFRSGMQAFTDRLADRLGSRLRLGAAVRGLSLTAKGEYELELDTAGSITADAVILALPALSMANLLGALDAGLAQLLRLIPHGSGATLTCAWPRSAVRHPLDAFGFVVPRSEQRALIACTWVSQKFAHRAPPGHALLRAFFGGDAGEPVLRASDDDLVRLGIAELQVLLGISAPPMFTRLARHVDALPRYTLGHADRVANIDARVARWPRLALAGNALHGVGIPDAIAAGERAARRVQGWAPPTTP